MALPPQNRLRSSRDFARVHRQGMRAATRHLAARALKPRTLKPRTFKPSALKPSTFKPSGPQPPRLKPLLKSKALPTGQAEATRISADGHPSALVSSFGISISRKVSKQAVVRNRIKRQIKAAIRRFLPNIAPGWQVVIVVRSAAVECEFDDFLRELEYLLKKLKILTQL